MSTTAEKVDIAVYQKAKQENACCGDSFFYKQMGNQFVCALADGLGSGKFARESAQTVINVVKEYSHLPDRELARLCTKKLVGQRGVVLGILILDYEIEEFRFLSIGNIGLRTITKDKSRNRNIPSQGYLGGYQRYFKVMHEKLEPNMKFFLFTDGVLDKELGLDYFYYADVDETIDAFQNLIDEPRADDTTLIALNYHG